MIEDYDLPLHGSSLKTGDNFEIEKLSNGNAVFVSGVAAAGNSYGPVDSYFGQQYVALKTLEYMGLDCMNGLKSLNGWYKRMRNKKI